MPDIMSANGASNHHCVIKVVLTGGPCGGKTTGQARLSSFFESLGWKVYRVPEIATLLLGGGVKFPDLSEAEVYQFQQNLICTMMQMEKTFFDLAESCHKHCIVICDRGVMDATAYMSREQWQQMRLENNWNEVDLRDNRYHLVIHLVSAARGAEAFYTVQHHAARHEGLEFARQLDDITSQAWVGHPYFNIIDNTTDFERKMMRMLATVCNQFGIEATERLAPNTRKRKFLVGSIPKDSEFPTFRDFIVIHDYLVTPSAIQQARLRKRGEEVQWIGEEGRWDTQSGHWTYTHTIRKPEIDGQSPEVRMQITGREYEILIAQKDINHFTIFKRRRCFLWKNQYFQLDIYLEPCHPRCRGLILLEMYTTLRGDRKELDLPSFLNIVKEVTGEPEYSMFNLSSKTGKDQSDKIKAVHNSNCMNERLTNIDLSSSSLSVEDGVKDSLKHDSLNNTHCR